MTERFRVGDVVFDATTGEIESASGTQRLQPQPALVLATLVRRTNTLVGRDELRDIVWPGTVSDTDDGLNYCIRQIRAALGDGVSGARYIETLPRRGYRMVAPVTREPTRGVANEVGLGSVGADAVHERRPVRVERSRRRVRIALGIAAVLGAGAVLSLVRGDVRPAEWQSVAVLPLSTPTDTGSGWASAINDAITERLVEHLTNAASPRGRIVGPVTTRAYVRDQRPHTELGAALGVDYVMSGGVRERDSTIFIQAVRSRDGAHVFAWRVPVGGRSVGDVFQDLTSALADRAKSW